MRKLTSLVAAALLTFGAVACQTEEPMDDIDDMDDMSEGMDDLDDGEEM